MIWLAHLTIVGLVYLVVLLALGAIMAGGLLAVALLFHLLSAIL